MHIPQQLIDIANFKKHFSQLNWTYFLHSLLRAWPAIALQHSRRRATARPHLMALAGEVPCVNFNWLCAWLGSWEFFCVLCATLINLWMLVIFSFLLVLLFFAFAGKLAIKWTVVSQQGSARLELWPAYAWWLAKGAVKLLGQGERMPLRFKLLALFVSRRRKHRQIESGR